VQAFPSRFSQSGIGSDNVTDHLPGRKVQRALRRRPHGERNGALRAKTNSLRGRFLARTYSHRLREKIHGNGFPAGLNFAIATQTKQIFQK
jgi:hypothetical protein